ncbi:phosphotransferase family protein [Sediminibacterium sp.]|uniref:phosphotransferase family protein n=1 Tax=Sediminibacterium sp. TaxID=1917865 RepID=UPI0025EE0C36|nr:phosphotransferase family protein [Sediminibacterium sp.]MBT9483966.1 phosphotransferase family protein [Sediminibacterium sp.]
MEKTVALSEKESFDLNQLNDLLLSSVPGVTPITLITRFAGGYSNLTYQLTTSNKNFVMRMAPPGANIQSAHDMGREYKVLSLLKPFFNKIPQPILYSTNTQITGTPFYIMEQLEGIILRAHNAPKLAISPTQFEHCSKQLVETLAQLHAINIESTQLVQLGKPEGYVNRQVEGWIKRYYNAETDLIASMNRVAEWLQNNHPKEQAPSLLHNDFKYDNIIFNSDLTEVIGVLDWEMATVGDPLMDLGAMLAYWFEQNEEPIFKQYNCTWLPGNLSRSDLIAYYALITKRDLSDINYYYVFGLFKNAVIAQQIYHRYKQGFSNDERFGALLPLIQLLGEKALKASS